jgi:hypothetical protein
MTAQPHRLRRLARTLAQHAACVMPYARSPWAEAMRRELDYIADDPAALRWALGCVVASYRARLTQRAKFSTRAAWRVAFGSGVMIGLALQANAGGPTQPSPPAFDEAQCDQPQREAMRHLPQQESQNQDRVPFDRPADTNASISCGSDCAHPLAVDISGACK